MWELYKFCNTLLGVAKQGFEINTQLLCGTLKPFLKSEMKINVSIECCRIRRYDGYSLIKTFWRHLHYVFIWCHRNEKKVKLTDSGHSRKRQK